MTNTEQELANFNKFLSTNPFGDLNAPPSSSERTGLIGRSFEQLLNLPSNIGSNLLGTVRGIGESVFPEGTYTPEQLALKPSIPKPFDIPKPEGFGEQAIDLIGGTLAPELGAALIPGGLVSKGARALGAGRIAADVLGNVAAGAASGIKQSPEEALHSSLVWGGLAGLGELSPLKRLIPLAGLGAADAAFTYHETDSSQAALTAGALDVGAGFLPDAINKLLRKKVAVHPQNEEILRSIADKPYDVSSAGVGEAAAFPIEGLPQISPFNFEAGPQARQAQGLMQQWNPEYTMDENLRAVVPEGKEVFGGSNRPTALGPIPPELPGPTYTIPLRPDRPVNPFAIKQIPEIAPEIVLPGEPRTNLTPFPSEITPENLGQFPNVLRIEPYQTTPLPELHQVERMGEARTSAEQKVMENDPSISPPEIIQDQSKSKIGVVPSWQRSLEIQGIPPLLGGIVGSQIGDTPEEQRRNALLGAAAGFALHGALRHSLLNPLLKGIPDEVGGIFAGPAKRTVSGKIITLEPGEFGGHPSIEIPKGEQWAEDGFVTPEGKFYNRLEAHDFAKQVSPIYAERTAGKENPLSSEGLHNANLTPEKEFAIRQMGLEYQGEQLGLATYKDNKTGSNVSIKGDEPFEKIQAKVDKSRAEFGKGQVESVDAAIEKARQGIGPINQSEKAFFTPSTHTSLTVLGGVAGAEEGYRQSKGDPKEAFLYAILGAGAGYLGYHALDALARTNTRIRIGEVKTAVKDIHAETVSAAKAIMDKKVTDIGGQDVRGEGGIMSKFVRGLEFWVRKGMPDSIKTAWTQARGAGALVVEQVQRSLQDLRATNLNPTEATLATGNKFIQGQLLNKADVLADITQQGGMKEEAWSAIEKKDRPDYASWQVGEDRYRVPKALKESLIKKEESMLMDTLDPKDLQYGKFLLTARRGLDTLQDMLAEGMPEGKLKELIQNSIGQYVTRTYKIFTDKNYRPTEEQIRNSMAELGAFKDNRFIEAAENSGQAFTEKNFREIQGGTDASRKARIKDFEKVSHNGETYYLDPKHADEFKNLYNDDFLRNEIATYLNDIKTTKEIYHVGTKKTLDTTLLKEREELSPTFRELLGEYTDPKERILQAINRLYPSAQASRFISNVSEFEIDGVKAALNDIDWVKQTNFLKDAIIKETDPAKLTDLRLQYDKLKAYVDIPKNLKYGMLKDMKVSRFVADQLQGYRGPWGVWEAPVGRGMAYINNITKMSRTAYSPLQHVRQWITSPIFAAIGKATPSSLEVARKAIFSKNEIYLEMLQNGIFTADQVAGEFRGQLNDVFNGHYDSDIAKKLTSFHRGALELYRIPDLIVRGGTYIEAKARYAKELNLPSESPEVIRKAVEWTDRRTMNYDNISPAIQTGRQIPIVNLFISYQAEMLRLVKNLAIDGAGKGPTGKVDIGALAILGGIAALPEIFQQGSEHLLNPKDRKEWDRTNRLGPDYNRQRFKIVTGKDTKGNFHYIDFSPLVVTDNFNEMIRGLAKGDLGAVGANNPAFGWQNTPAWNIIAEQVAGRDLRTQRDFRDGADRLESIVKEIVPNLTPGIGYEWKKIAPPSLGGTLGVENLKTGRTDTLESAIWRYAAGMNKTSVNPTAVNKAYMARTKQEIANEKAYLNDVLKSTNPTPVKERAIQRYKDSVKFIIEDFRKHTN